MALLYSCCFWFSLRLGGILISLFNFCTTTVFLIGEILALYYPEVIKEFIQNLNESYDLAFVHGLFENILYDLNYFINAIIISSCVYMISCLLFLYGAYKLVVKWMILYIFLEFIHLIIIWISIVTFLIILKKNFDDLGTQIILTLVGLLVLLGYGYFWLCTINLPAVMNELENEKRQAEINMLKTIIKLENQQHYNREINDVIPAFSEKSIIIIKSYNRRSNEVKSSHSY